MEYALIENPGPGGNGQTTERSLIQTESNMSQKSKTSREREIYLYNSEYLKNNYDKYIRDDFLYAFGAFYCSGRKPIESYATKMGRLDIGIGRRQKDILDKVMKIPHLDRILKTECYHRETELKYRHYEFATYMENIISWLDLKLKYFNGEPSESNKKIQEQLFKTSYNQQHGTTMSLNCKSLDSNTIFHEQNNKSRTVANFENEIITSPDITIKNDDFPASLTYDHNTEIVMQNTQNKLMMTKITSPKHNFAGSSTNNNNKKGIDKVNNTQNIIKTSPNVTSSEHVTLRNSTTDHEKRIDMINNTQNTIKISPDNTSPKQDTLGNSTTDHGKRIDMVNNTQNKIITSPNIASPKNVTLGNSSNEHKKGISMVNKTQNKIITSPCITSPKHVTLGNSSNDHKKRISMINNTQNTIKISLDNTSPKQDTLGNSTTDHGKRIDMVNNTQNKIITSPNIASPKHVTLGNSSNEPKKGISMANKKKKIFTSPNVTSPKHVTLGNSSNDHKKRISMINNTQNTIKISLDNTSPKQDTLRNSTTDHGKRIDMVNNTQNKIITSPNIASPKHVTLGNSSNEPKKGISMANKKKKIFTSPNVTSPKHVTLGNSTNNHKKGIDMINTNLVNISSAADSISTESQFKNLDITDDVNESTSENLKNNTNDKVVNEDKLTSVQSSSNDIISEEISNMCLETSTKSIRCTRANKQTNKIISTTSTKRSNSVTDSEHKSKKKKIEKPSPSYVEKKTNTNNNKISVKALNESIKQVTKNVYCRNSKGETKLHSACAKGKLDLVASLLEDGFNPNVKDNAGWTPMHEAVKSGNVDIVKELIKFGAYLNVPGFEYESPLYTAIKYGKFEIAKILLSYGSDANFINMYGDNARCLNEEKLSELLENLVSSKSTQIFHPNYKLEETVIALNNVSLKSATVNTFCKQFNIKLVQNILKEKQFAQVTHMIVSKTKNNTCDVNLECLSAIANGLFIINENWLSDSLDQNKLLKCENYEVSGTTLFADSNGPKISRISKQKLYPKLFDGINIHISGSHGWNQFTLENLKKLVVEFGAKLLIRMPNPEDCPTNIIPYHCRNNDQMFHVSNIILYTMDSSRLIKYNMKHLKAFHISWFMEAVQKYII